VSLELVGLPAILLEGLPAGVLARRSRGGVADWLAWPLSTFESKFGSFHKWLAKLTYDVSNLSNAQAR